MRLIRSRIEGESGSPRQGLERYDPVMTIQGSPVHSSSVKQSDQATCSGRGDLFQGMACVDTSGNKRIPILMEMVGAISRATEPNEVLRDFAEGIRKLEGSRGYISLSTRGLKPGEYKITRLLKGDQMLELSEANPWGDWDEMPVHRGGFLAEIIRQAYPEIIHNMYLKDDPVLGNALADYGSMMAIPLFDNGEPLNWAILLREGPEDYSVADLEEVILRANLVGTTVRNVMAAKTLREANEANRREVDQIARIQRALLPKELPDIPGVSLGAHYEMFDLAGGDMYDFVPLRKTADRKSHDPNGPWALLIADASGHGPAAATVVAMLNAILYAAPAELDSPGKVLAFANQHLVDKGFEGTFVTALLCHYCPVSREFVYARAGHTPAVLMTPGPPAHIVRLDAVGGVPLGVLEGVEYQEDSITLDPGQTIVLYTDGITEAFSPQGRMFGLEGIEKSLLECTGAPDCVISHVTEALKAHESSVRPNDDQTIVVMKVHERVSGTGNREA